MSKSATKGELDADVTELSILLKNRTFVDYFNIFMCLPVFGQHAFYNFMASEFEFEPPISQKRNLHIDQRREILQWLCTKRFRTFRCSLLYTEYVLSTKVRCIDVDFPGIKNIDENGVDRNTFIRNVLGSATGMILFRESMRGTCGESVYQCWKDIEAWRHIEDPVRKMYWKNAIKNKYISQNNRAQVKGKIKLMVFQGTLNFDLVPDHAIQKKVIDVQLFDSTRQMVDSSVAMTQLQSVLLDALRKYWVPRYLLHIMKTTSQETLDILKRPVPEGFEQLSQKRQLHDRYMFPTIYQESNINSPATTVFVSKSAGEISRLPRRPASVAGTRPSKIDLFVENDSGIEHKDLLSLWGGPCRDIEIDDTTMSVPAAEEESVAVICKGKAISTKLSADAQRIPIPHFLTSYLGGRTRTMLGSFPNTPSRIFWSIASDVLACCPFRSFLEITGQIRKVHYWSFWTDVRNYLDADENSVDNFGQSIRKLMAQGLASKYLSMTCKGYDIFTDKTKKSLSNAIVDNNDISLLSMAQDIVQKSLWEPLKLYMENERMQFQEQVRSHQYELASKRRKHVETMAKKSGSCSSVSTLETEANFVTSSNPPVHSSKRKCVSAASRPVISNRVFIKEEHTVKAMEMAVLCCEYGASMMMPHYPLKPEKLLDIIYSDYGSLHVPRTSAVSRTPAVRNAWLRELIQPPKINIETIKVSRKVLEDSFDRYDSETREIRAQEEFDAKHAHRRRIGLAGEVPVKSRSFVEVINTPKHFELFKRFLKVHNAAFPLLFWKAVKDLKDVKKAKTKEFQVYKIVQQFFGKRAKYGDLLNCSEEIIRQIPQMHSVPLAMLTYAQQAVCRSMEKNWYLLYIETCPAPDLEASSSDEDIEPLSAPLGVAADFRITNIMDAHKALRTKKLLLKKKKRHFNWQILAKELIDFNNAMTSRSKAYLLEIYVKCELENPGLKTQSSHSTPIERNIMMSSLATSVLTRVVVRNRLVVLNRLPADIRYWIEVKKYQDVVDSSYMKGYMSKMDQTFLTEKAKAIIDCYLASKILPEVQLNIPVEMAHDIIKCLEDYGPVRRLFHDSIMLLFPLLYHYYRKFTDEWVIGTIPYDFVNTIKCAFSETVHSLPHPHEPIPDFVNVKVDNIKTTTQIMLAEQACMRYQFSICEGISCVNPIPPKKKSVRAKRILRKQYLSSQNEEIQSASNIINDGRQVKQDKDKTIQEMNVVVKSESQKSTVSSENAFKRMTAEKVRRVSNCMESLKKEREEMTIEQNIKLIQKAKFGDVVMAAVAVYSD